MINNPIVIVIFLITFSLFFIEALLHFNFGVESNGDHKICNIFGLKVHIPSLKELGHITIVLIIFSSLNSLISNKILKKLEKK